MFSKLKLKKPPLVLIAVPCYQQVWAETATCVLNLTHSAAYDSIVTFHRGGLIHRSRNQLVRLFLDRPEKPDYLLFVDSDMMFKADALQQLIDDHKDVVTGNAFTRKYPVRPVVGRFSTERDGEVETLINFEKEALQQVESCGMAFTLISRRALERVGPHPFNFIYFPETDRELPEDSSFCWNARKAGLQVWLDSRVQVGHIGEVVFDERDFEAGKEDLLKQTEEIARTAKA